MVTVVMIVIVINQKQLDWQLKHCIIITTDGQTASFSITWLRHLRIQPSRFILAIIKLMQIA